MWTPNLFSKKIYSTRLLQSEPEYGFPGLPDLVIAFYTIFILIMQVDSISNVTRIICETTGFFFINSITFSILTLHILLRASQLSDHFKRKWQYKLIAPSLVAVIICLTLLLFWIPIRDAEHTNRMDIAYKFMIVLFVSNGVLLFFHTWLWLAHVDYFTMIRNRNLLRVQASFLQLALLAAPYMSYLICVWILILYLGRNAEPNLYYCFGKVLVVR